MAHAQLHICTNHRDIYRRVRVYLHSRLIDYGRWDPEMPVSTAKREVKRRLARDHGYVGRVSWDID